MPSPVQSLFFALACAASAVLSAPSAWAAPPPGPRADRATELLEAERAFTLDDAWEPLFDWLTAVGSVTAFGLAADSIGRDGFDSAGLRWVLIGTRIGGLRTISRTVHRPDLARACVHHTEHVETCVREAADRGYTLRSVRRVFNGAGALAGVVGYGLSGNENLLLPAAASTLSVVLDFFPTQSERLMRDRLGFVSLV
ncbi:MAG: hypothetical protein MUF34_32025, partial [Polyangiaceae bacterium]|nr:hypothetical protein [Polyangiaceae bacterium]